jgi:Domain of unknown function (DUF4266)
MNAYRIVAPALTAATLLLGGCSIEPWVKPYERERLADPIMKFSRDALADKHREHVFDDPLTPCCVASFPGGRACWCERAHKACTARGLPACWGVFWRLPAPTGRNCPKTVPTRCSTCMTAAGSRRLGLRY